MNSTNRVSVAQLSGRAGGIGWRSSQARIVRALGSRESSLWKMVEPVRGRPTTQSGSFSSVAHASGCSRRHAASRRWLHPAAQIESARAAVFSEIDRS